MKAMMYHRYGSPDVLQMREVETPTPQEDEVLVKIHASAVNPLDWHIMRAQPMMSRFASGLFKPKRPILGADIAGVVEKVGNKVTRFKVGDAVFGDIGAGGFAEYACAKEHLLVLKPAHVPFEKAAAAPVASLTALQGLRNKGNIQTRQKVLVNGASGGVGSSAVQIATAYGAKVTGVCSGRNADMVRSIGAVNTIDYTRQNFTRMGIEYDLIYDAVGNHSITDYQRALKTGGACVVAGFSSMSHMMKVALFGNLRAKRQNKPVILQGSASSQLADLETIQQFLAEGKLDPVIDRTYHFHEVADAIRYLETMRARGKVIINNLSL